MKGERGYTLVEALIAIAITGFLVTVISMAVQQIVTVPERGDDQRAHGDAAGGQRGIGSHV